MRQTGSQGGRLADTAVPFGDNSFDWIRLYAAFSIMWGHLMAHFRLTYPVWMERIRSLFPGVILLFVISGYLGAASYERCTTGGQTLKSGIKAYARSRFLRVYPALWAAFIVSAVSILIVYRVLPSPFEAAAWVATQATVCQFYTPGFLRGYGVGAPNGSLWTIPVTVQFYVLIPLLYRFLKKRTALAWGLMIFVSMLLSVGVALSEALLPHNLYMLLCMTFLPYLYLLLIGMLLYLKRDTLLALLLKRYWLLFPLYIAFRLSNGIWGYFPYGEYIDVLSGLLLGFVVITTAYKLGRHRLKNDISYGVFLYHMVIINVFVQLGWTQNWWILVLTVALAVGCGFASWFGIERPCQRLKLRQNDEKARIHV